MKSSTAAYYIIKIGSVVLMLFFIYIITLSLSTGSPFTSHDLRSWEFWLSWAALSPLAILVWKMAIIRCSGGMMIVWRNGKDHAYKWHEVAAMHQLPFSTPPLYRISFNTGDSSVLIMARPKFLFSIGLWSWDFSGLRQYIQERIQANAAGPTRLPVQPQPQPTQQQHDRPSTQTLQSAPIATQPAATSTQRLRKSGSFTYISTVAPPDDSD